MNKWTPGKWYVDPPTNSTFSIEIFTDNKELKSNWVASVHQQFNGPEMGIANARVISVAPEMYESLKQVKSYFDSFKNDWKEGEVLVMCKIDDLLTRINTPLL